MRNAHQKTSVKLLASAALVAAAAGVAGLGTFGSFTSTTSASASVGAGTVKVALGAANTAANRLNLPATGLVPGDAVQRAVVLTNSGTQDLSTLSLTTAATTSSKLDTDATGGLQLSVESCSVPWTEAGSSPAFTYTCGGTTKTVLATRPAIGTGVALGALASLQAGGTDHLVVRLALPAAADNTFQGLSSVIGLDFTATQRTATNK
jgi:hypothetical protein